MPVEKDCTALAKVADKIDLLCNQVTEAAELRRLLARANARLAGAGLRQVQLNDGDDREEEEGLGGGHDALASAPMPAEPADSGGGGGVVGSVVGGGAGGSVFFPVLAPEWRQSGSAQRGRAAAMGGGPGDGHLLLSLPWRVPAAAPGVGASYLAGAADRTVIRSQQHSGAAAGSPMPRGESSGGTGRRGLAWAASELHAFLVAARLEQVRLEPTHSRRAHA